MMTYLQALIDCLIPAAGGALAALTLLLLVRLSLGRETGLCRMGLELTGLTYLFTLSGVTGFAGCLLAIPSYDGPRLINLLPLVTEPMVLMLLNFLLFLPLGVLLPLLFPGRRWSWQRALAAGFALSLLIETVQYFGGRAADIDDLMMNAAGAAFGYLLYLLGRALTDRALTGAFAARCAGAWMGAAAFFAGASFVCLR